jgi:hypothetical protein
MKEYYNLVDAIFGYLDGNETITTVTFGDIFELDMSNQTIFPLAHVTIGDVAFEDRLVNFSVNVLVMDIVDETKDDRLATDKPHLGMDNKQDILNSMLSVVNGLQSSLRRGGLEENGFVMTENPLANIFEDRIGSLLTGWSINLSVQVQNNTIPIISATGT